MLSETGLKWLAAVCTVFCIVIIVFACYGLLMLIEGGSLLDREVVFFGAFSVIAVSVLAILVTMLTRRTREALEDEVAFLRNRIMELEKAVNPK
ncbi:hypothetical protein D3P07_10430 [Paenibacillus sp. 1011MAR3C5]|uniref:hypothetical protein n=1 Tax=Paenibacillus sp. 1011MAR3C5 TaxID=1675787 RepID=UPI000E6C2BA5|nr:hypothetical protein [Paenibacillus sp. 1011MAR3C5]RJE88413.1 hypothetical protein D3P07_10430 [Paenibacillus sp. 1011MAR3C5]